MTETDPTPASSAGKNAKQVRNGEETKERILTAAIEEFCAHGYAGANTARITRGAGCNIRMLYHYFENKDGLYLAALTRVYEELRSREDETKFWDLPPKDGVVALTHFTFDYMIQSPSFARMIMNENLNMGRGVVHVSAAISATAEPFINKIDSLLLRGHASGDFTQRIDGFDLYLTILALSFIHISNQHTLSAVFKTDLASAAFLANRRKQVANVVLSYVTAVG